MRSRRPRPAGGDIIDLARDQHELHFAAVVARRSGRVTTRLLCLAAVSRREGVGRSLAPRLRHGSISPAKGVQ
jgi:hypothetical protein